MMININNVMIEITRKCNMKCDHCLRGKAENRVIDYKYIDSLFSKVEHIGTLTITGGEPSLHPEVIREIIKLAKHYQIEIGSFYIATNGKKITYSFVMACLELYLYCYDNEMSQLAVTKDNYHDEIDQSHEILAALSFFSYRGSGKNLINEGYAFDNGIGKRMVDVYPYEISDGYIGEGDVYLNCNGDIIASCDLSYESQEDYKVCHVDEMSVEKFQEFNSSFDLK